MFKSSLSLRRSVRELRLILERLALAESERRAFSSVWHESSAGVCFFQERMPGQKKLRQTSSWGALSDDRSENQLGLDPSQEV